MVFDFNKVYRLSGLSKYKPYNKNRETCKYTANLTIKKIHGEIPEKICTEGEKRCSDNNLEQCINNSWKLIEECEYGCNSTLLKCNKKQAEIPEKICTEGEKKCSDNNLQECKDNTWTTIESCEYGCNRTTLSCNSAPVEKPKEKPIPILIIIAGIIVIVGICYYLLKSKKII